VNRGSEQHDLDSDVISIKSISNLKNLISAYELLKKKETDGITLKYLENIQKDLRAGKFKFSERRSPREKVVEKAILIVMNEHYEKKLNKRSFGFRPGKGVQDAILYVDQKFRSSKWVIEGNISLCSD